MDFTAVRADLKTALEVIEGLTVHPDWPDRITPPAAAFGPPDTVAYRATYHKGMIRATIALRVLVTRTPASNALNVLDPYLSDSGPKSVVAAVDAHAATAYSVATVTQLTESGVYSVAGADYLGATFDIDVVGSGG